MPPIWLCRDCEGVAYGWARGPCIHCGSRRVASTDPNVQFEESPCDYRVLLFTEKAWAQLETEAILAGKPVRQFITEREEGEVVLIRDEPVDNGRLILLQSNVPELCES